MNHPNRQKVCSLLLTHIPRFLLIPVLLVIAALVGATEGEEVPGVKTTKRLTLKGPPKKSLINQTADPDISNNISGVAAKGKLLVVGADEGADILVFKKQDDIEYREKKDCISLDKKKCGSKRKGTEIDIEGIAWGKKFLYVTGSHSRARKDVEKGGDANKNRERLKTLKIEPTREQLFRIEMDRDGNLAEDSNIKMISLRSLFVNHRILSLFQSVPSKENGIDIEGLAVKEIDGADQLYLGFRGPVLRGNHAIIMVLEFERDDGPEKVKFKEKEIKKDPKIHYVNLGGRGIRGMTEVGSSGFLLLAGPVGDSDMGKIGDIDTRYQLYFWDGESDDLSGTARKPVCNVPVPEGGKAEGIDLLNKDKTATDDYRFLVVYDSAAKGSSTVHTCAP